MAQVKDFLVPVAAVAVAAVSYFVVEDGKARFNAEPPSFDPNDRDLSPEYVQAQHYTAAIGQILGGGVGFSVAGLMLICSAANAVAASQRPKPLKLGEGSKGEPKSAWLEL